jgi:pilus assembly protein CpaE
MTSFDHSNTDLTGVSALSIALIGPHERNRKAVANALLGSEVTMIREFNSYPPELADVSRMLEKNYDIVIIDLDSDQKFALELVENVAGVSPATIMVYSSQTDPGVLVRCMRAGAREFLTFPLDTDSLVEALARAAGRRPAKQVAKEKRRQAVGVSGQQRRHRCNHGGMQFCGGAGSGVCPEYGIDRS